MARQQADWVGWPQGLPVWSHFRPQGPTSPFCSPKLCMLERARGHPPGSENSAAPAFGSKPWSTGTSTSVETLEFFYLKPTIHLLSLTPSHSFIHSWHATHTPLLPAHCHSGGISNTAGVEVPLLISLLNPYETKPGGARLGS